MPTHKKKPTTKTTTHVEYRGKHITLFESRVYELIATIPKGKVSTYGIVAKKLRSSPRGVGQALRRNPFVPEIPCHRIVAASLEIGGYKGTTGEKSPCVAEKRKLLTSEGVVFTADHKIDQQCVYTFDDKE